MKRYVWMALVSLAFATGLLPACGPTPTDDSTSGCSAGQVSCGSCSNEGAPACTVCCPSSAPFWCVDGSGNSNCYSSEQDATGTCLSQVNSCN
jgi:hypothetical protein